LSSEEPPFQRFLVKYCWLKLKNAYLLISSPQGERMKVRGIYLDSTLTPTLSRQQERGND
jgi:hypothetical protein